LERVYQLQNTAFLKRPKTSGVVEAKDKIWPSAHDEREVKSILVAVKGFTLKVMFMIRSKTYTRTGIGHVCTRASVSIRNYTHAFVVQ
jgi:hypothetical protein